MADSNPVRLFGEKQGTHDPGNTYGPLVGSRSDGGAGNRTLVRTSIQRSVSVRRPSFTRGPGPVVGPPSRNEPLTISPAARGGSRQASPALLFGAAAPGGLRHRRLLPRADLSLRSQRQIRVGSWNFSKRFYQEPGPGHAATPSTDPSKPVAPSRFEY